MKVSKQWLQTFFNDSLQSAEELSQALTFHVAEVEGVERVGNDEVIDVKVLPDRAPYLLSHRGVAYEIGAIVGKKMDNDPLFSSPQVFPTTDKIHVSLHTDKVATYQTLLIENVTVRESPAWLKERLEAIGQRSINNIVDATNYVMFEIGQPLHAFDGSKLSSHNGVYKIGVRFAKSGEQIETLDAKTLTLTEEDLVIVDEGENKLIGIAGIKGGKAAQIDGETKTIIVESAHFDAQTVRKTSKRLSLRTDASYRFENNITPQLAAYALSRVAAIIAECAGGSEPLFSGVTPKVKESKSVSISFERIKKMLGIHVTHEKVKEIFSLLDCGVEIKGDVLTVIPPWYRQDIVIEEDIVDEIGRMIGYEHIPAVDFSQKVPVIVDKKFYYADSIRDTLAKLGFSEIITSSFENKDEVKLANALASDKTYLRSTLIANLSRALTKNMYNAPLFGLETICLFEIGNVFTNHGEKTKVAIGVSHKKKATADALCRDTVEKLETMFGSAHVIHVENGMCELDLYDLIENAPEPSAYEPYTKKEKISYKAFSLYPFIVRDIAFFSSKEIVVEEVQNKIATNAGVLLLRIDLFDTFEKKNEDGTSKFSYAFRLVFQSNERTLSDEEVNNIMNRISESLKDGGFEVR